MKYRIAILVIILFCAMGTALAQTYTLEIHARIDGELGYCDSLLSLTGAVPGAGIHSIADGDTVTMSINTTPIEVAMGTRDSCFALDLCCGVMPFAVDTTGGSISVSFVMTDDISAYWWFMRQFTFEVTCSRDYDSPEPDYGLHWFDKGDSITASIDMMVGDTVCLGYIGTGSVVTGYSNSWTGILDEPSTLNWYINIAEPPCSLIVVSEHGECSPYTGVSYFPRGCYITAYVSAVDSSDSALGMIYTCIGWRGTGCVPATGPTPYVPPYNICELEMSSSGTLEWLWDTLYTGIEEDLPSAKPEAFAISAYPNPFNSAVTISLDCHSRVQTDALSGKIGNPEIEIFDINGRRVYVISSEGFQPDEKSPTYPQEISPYSRNDSGCEFIWQPEESLGSGIYFVSAKIGSETVSTRILYLK